MTRNMILALAALALFAGLYAKGRYDGAALANAAHAMGQLEAERFARAKERNMQNAVDQQAREFVAQEAIAAANVAVATGQLDRLRADLAAIAGGDPSTPSSPVTARIAGILGECTGQLVEVAGEADRLAAIVAGWQDYYMVIAPRE